MRLLHGSSGSVSLHERSRAVAEGQRLASPAVPRRAVLTAEFVLATIDLYLLALLAAAALGRGDDAAVGGGPEPLVLIPAHDEAASLAPVWRRWPPRLRRSIAPGSS